MKSFQTFLPDCKSIGTSVSTLILSLCLLSVASSAETCWNQITEIEWNAAPELWEKTDPLPTMSDAVWTGERFVFTAEREIQIGTSTNGRDWSLITPPNPLSGGSLAIGDSGIIIAGSGGTLLHSTNGLDWSHIPLQTSKNLTGAAFGNDLWVAVGNETLLTSADGLNWTNHSDRFTPEYHSIAFGNGHFVALSNGNSYTSTDGINWSRNPGPKVQIAFSNLRLRFLRDRFFAMNSRELLVSTDGTSWQVVLESEDPYLNPPFIMDVTFSNGRFLALGEKEASTILFSSLDGTNWHSSLIDPSPHTRKVIVANEDLILISGTRPLLSDLRQPMRKINGIASANGRFIAIGSSGRIIHSPNGLSWTESSAAALGDLHDIIHDGENFIAVGTHGTIITSENGEIWSRKNSETNRFLLGISHGNGRHIAVGSDQILFSDDLENWQKGTLTLPNPTPNETGLFPDRPISFRSVAFGNNSFITVGGDGTILRSTDGETWSIITRNLVNSLNSIAFGNGRFVAVSMTGLILTSETGEKWQIHQADPLRSFSKIRFINGTFFATSFEGDIFTSPDGTEWSKQCSPGTQLLADFTADQNRLIAIGPNGAIFQSEAFPIFLNQPADQQLSTGENFTLSASATSHRPLSFQWYHNNQPIPGATSSFLQSETGASLSDDGLYHLEIDDGLRKIRSTRAKLSVKSDYIDWLAESSHTPEDLANPEISAPAADPDGLNIPNLIRYAFSLDPHSPNRLQLPKLSLIPSPFYGEPDTTALILPQLRNDPDLIFSLEESTDLINWSSTQFNQPDNHRFELFSNQNRNLLLLNETGENQKTFFRISVTLPEN